MCWRPRNDQGRYGQRCSAEAFGVPTVNPEPGRRLAHFFRCWRRDVGWVRHLPSLARFGGSKEGTRSGCGASIKALDLAHRHTNLCGGENGVSSRSNQRRGVDQNANCPGPVHTVHMDLICPSSYHFPIWFEVMVRMDHVDRSDRLQRSKGLGRAVQEGRASGFVVLLPPHKQRMAADAHRNPILRSVKL